MSTSKNQKPPNEQPKKDGKQFKEMLKAHLDRDDCKNLRAVFHQDKKKIRKTFVNRCEDVRSRLGFRQTGKDAIQWVLREFLKKAKDIVTFPKLSDTRDFESIYEPIFQKKYAEEMFPETKKFFRYADQAASPKKTGLKMFLHDLKRALDFEPPLEELCPKVFRVVLGTLEELATPLHKVPEIKPTPDELRSEAEAAKFKCVMHSILANEEDYPHLKKVFAGKTNKVVKLLDENIVKLMKSEFDQTALKFAERLSNAFIVNAAVFPNRHASEREIEDILAEKFEEQNFAVTQTSMKPESGSKNLAAFLHHFKNCVKFESSLDDLHAKICKMFFDTFEEFAEPRKEDVKQEVEEQKEEEEEDEEEIEAHCSSRQVERGGRGPRAPTRYEDYQYDVGEESDSEADSDYDSKQEEDAPADDLQAVANVQNAVVPDAVVLEAMEEEIEGAEVQLDVQEAPGVNVLIENAADQIADEVLVIPKPAVVADAPEANNNNLIDDEVLVDPANEDPIAEDPAHPEEPEVIELGQVPMEVAEQVVNAPNHDGDIEIDVEQAHPDAPMAVVVEEQEEVPAQAPNALDVPMEVNDLMDQDEEQADEIIVGPAPDNDPALVAGHPDNLADAPAAPPAVPMEIDEIDGEVEQNEVDEDEAQVPAPSPVPIPAPTRPRAKRPHARNARAIFAQRNAQLLAQQAAQLNEPRYFRQFPGQPPRLDPRDRPVVAPIPRVVAKVQKKKAAKPAAPNVLGKPRRGPKRRYPVGIPNHKKKRKSKYVWPPNYFD